MYLKIINNRCFALTVIQKRSFLTRHCFDLDLRTLVFLERCLNQLSHSLILVSQRLKTATNKTKNRFLKSSIYKAAAWGHLHVLLMHVWGFVLFLHFLTLTVRNDSKNWVLRFTPKKGTPKNKKCDLCGSVQKHNIPEK